jgi:hypothetical protein
MLIFHLIVCKPGFPFLLIFVCKTTAGTLAAVWSMLSACLLRLPTLGKAQLMKRLTMDWAAGVRFPARDAKFFFDTTSHQP